VELYVAAAYGVSAEEARRAAEAELAWAQGRGYARLAAETAAWWRTYWQATARVSLPDAGLQEIYELGMYKLAGLSWPAEEAVNTAEAPPAQRVNAARPAAVWPAATLQGPWVEEYRLPPWSADYHFNINVQECYWPAYGGNQLAALRPLWDMLRTWEPLLRANARQFLGLEGGLMLNHAVDDRGVAMGGFWTGAIDHGATAWVAQLMWQYYRYTLDEDFLAETAYPFMRGAMCVYEAMLERAPDGSYHLPVSVSPEYEGAAMWAWGRDASFQLAIIHFLTRALLRAVEILGLDEPAAQRWRDVAAHTPRGCLGGAADMPELYLWAGQPLAHSHRHHSHLAGLYPFDVFDPWGSDEDRALILRSAATWTRMGTGEWTGWCLPWAAILWARLHNGERAALLLNEFRHTFMTAGRATTHDATHPGFTVFDGRPEVMQIEAGLGAAAAVIELLAHTAGGVLYVFPAVPGHWETVRFDGIRTEGAFLVSAERSAGRTRWVRVFSTGRTRLRLAPLCPGRGLCISGNRIAACLAWPADVPIERDMAPGEEIYVTVD
jgi:alpha-L-fucosidase 2